MSDDQSSKPQLTEITPQPGAKAVRDERPWWKKKRFVITGAVLGLYFLAGTVALVAAVSDEELQEIAATTSTPTSAPTTTAQAPITTTAVPTTMPAPPPSQPTFVVSRADFGDRWPLTVESGVLRCLPGSAVTFGVRSSPGEFDAKSYAVNGTARMMFPEWPEIDEIWAQSESDPVLKKDIGPLIDEGLRRCEQ